MLILNSYLKGYSTFCSSPEQYRPLSVVAPYDPETKRINGTLFDLTMGSFFEIGRYSIGTLQFYNEKGIVSLLTLFNTFLQLEYSSETEDALVVVRGIKILPTIGLLIGMTAFSYWRSKLKKQRRAFAITKKTATQAN